MSVGSSSPLSSESPHALITGGEGDLARALARVLRARGWTVHAPGRKMLDVADACSVRQFFEGLSRCDLLVNNAGGVKDVLFARMREADWDAVLDTHLGGAARCSRAAARMMLRQKAGHILHIGSYSAWRGPVGQANYAAAKAALIGLGHALAAELGGRNIQVNTVLPGFLETKMTASLSPEVKEKARQDHLLGRFNTVAEAALFIARLAEMQHISGQVFQLDSRIRPWA